jgi:hypothetical protein
VNLHDAHVNVNGHPPPADKPRRGDLLLQDLRAVLQRFEDAQRKRRLADLTEAEVQAHEWELTEAGGEELAAGLWLADLLLLLLRYARRHRSEALAAALADVLAPDLDHLAEAIARLEGRR